MVKILYQLVIYSRIPFYTTLPHSASIASDEAQFDFRLLFIGKSEVVQLLLFVSCILVNIAAVLVTTGVGDYVAKLKVFVSS